MSTLVNPYHAGRPVEDVEMFFGRDIQAGKLIPLDTVSPVYRIVSKSGGETKVVRVRDCYVSHFVTCPMASEFSRPKEEGKKRGRRKKK